MNNIPLNLALLKNAKVVFFGAGQSGLKTLDFMLKNDVVVNYFVDNNNETHDFEFKGQMYCIKEPNALLRENKLNLKIVITPDGLYYDEIVSQLQEMGLGECIFSTYITACDQLMQYHFGFFGEKIGPCSRTINGLNKIEAPFSDYLNTPEETAKNYIKKIDTILYELNNNVEINAAKPCINCVSLRQYKYYGCKEVSKVSLDFYPAICQSRCIYCDNYTQPENSYENAKNSNAPKMAYEALSYLKANNLLRSNCFFSIAPGEITIAPWKNIVLDTAMGYRAWFYTNSFVFNDRIADSLKKNSSSIVVSIDSGTKRTFELIKGHGMFDTVIDNLKNYRKYGDVIVKYIILPGINDGDVDFDGIIEVCKMLNLKTLLLSFEDFLPFRSAFYPMMMLIKKLELSGFSFTMHSYCSNEQMTQFIEEYERNDDKFKDYYEKNNENIRATCRERQKEFMNNNNSFNDLYRKYILSTEIMRLLSYFKPGTRFSLLGYISKNRFIFSLYDQLNISFKKPNASYNESYERTKDTADIFIIWNKEEFNDVNDYIKLKGGVSGRLLDVEGYCFSMEQIEKFLKRSISAEFLVDF
ncbi:MAG: radical SAM protein [Clostridiales bacterium]|jgi:wyosine [tRNA(Phe)-imidazoG37] synthetase (radical SAM superfamily)|nr:radical SAM protein [Clostridiales bacterium]